MPNELGRTVPAFPPVVGVVPSHGWEGEARIRRARVRGDVREDLRLAGGRLLLGFVCGEGCNGPLWRPFGQVGRSSAAGANKGTSLDDPLASSARLRLEGYRPVARVGRLRSETALAANIGQEPRCPAVVAVPCAGLAPGLWNCVGPQRRALGVRQF